MSVDGDVASGVAHADLVAESAQPAFGDHDAVGDARSGRSHRRGVIDPMMGPVDAQDGMVAMLREIGTDAPVNERRAQKFAFERVSGSIVVFAFQRVSV